ncbi:MAG: FHA domain-containing protein [Peptococcaceae bacterium]|nr:FHA domain-containing protein [Peptococcaceae bacterium]
MIVTLVFSQGINTITLPDEKIGVFYLHDSFTPGPETQIVVIEGIDDEWIAKPITDVYMRDEHNTLYPSLTFEPDKMYTLSKGKPREIMKIFTESMTANHHQYDKYAIGYDLNGLTTLSIGRQENSIITIDSPYVSAQHARLVKELPGDPRWVIYDDDSTNGIYVNNKRVTEAVLNNGDTVTIVAGCRFTIINNLIVINNPFGRVRIYTKLLRPIEEFLADDLKNHTERNDVPFQFVPEQYFRTHQRSPRFSPTFPKPVFHAEGPPENQIGQEIPFIFTLGPAITLGLGSVTMMLFSVSTAMSRGDILTATPSMAMAASMLAGVVLWPILSKRFDKKRRHTKEALRQSKYMEYLKAFDAKLNKECERQTELLNKTWVDIGDSFNRTIQCRRDLWEREPGQDDFLTFRVGTGTRHLDADIKFPSEKFSLEDDNLRQQLQTMCQTPRLLKSVPITISLFENPISGIIGDRPPTV